MFFSLLYGRPANSAESQLLEAWPLAIQPLWNLLIRESADLGVAANSHFDKLWASNLIING